MEQEIKLQVLDKNNIDLRSLTWLTDLAEGETKSWHIVSTYFDTPDWYLLKNGLGLRLRKLQDQWFQTVKTLGIVKQGFHQRDEWEHLLHSPEWDIKQLQKTPLAPLIADSKKWATIKAIFTTDFTRQTLDVSLAEETKVELAYDVGHVRAGQLTELIHEIELELKTGSVEQLKWLSHLVCARLDLKPSNLSKAKQGYQLVAQSPLNSD